jgi:glycine/D-amino acid oxidase-like deaminating enzyme
VAPSRRLAGVGDAERDRERVRQRVQRLQTWGHPVEWVSRARAQALEPALTLPVGGEADEIALYGEGAWCEPRTFGRALLERAATRGATVHAGDPVTAVTRRQGRITEVVTARRVAGSVPTAS